MGRELMTGDPDHDARVRAEERAECAARNEAKASMRWRRARGTMKLKGATIYVVTRSFYDDHETLGVFDSKEKAVKFLEGEGYDLARIYPRDHGMLGEIWRRPDDNANIEAFTVR